MRQKEVAKYRRLHCKPWTKAKIVQWTILPTRLAESYYPCQIRKLVSCYKQATYRIIFLKINAILMQLRHVTLYYQSLHVFHFSVFPFFLIFFIFKKALYLFILLCLLISMFLQKGFESLLSYRIRTQ